MEQIDVKAKRAEMIEKSKTELRKNSNTIANDAEKRNVFNLLTQSNALRKRVDEMNIETSALQREIDNDKKDLQSLK